MAIKIKNWLLNQIEESKAVCLGQYLSSVTSFTTIKYDTMNGCFQGRLLGPELFNINCKADTCKSN